MPTTKVLPRACAWFFSCCKTKYLLPGPEKEQRQPHHQRPQNPSAISSICF